MPTFVGPRRKLRVSRDPSIVFEDRFDGGSLSGADWTVTDTGGNITVAGGELRFAGGASNWTGTLVTRKALEVRAGLRLDWDAIWSNLGSAAGGTVIGADATTPIAVPLAPAFVQQNGVLTVQTTGGRIVPVTIALNTRYYWRLVYLNPGVLFYIATASNGPFSLLWYEATGYTASQYPGYANYDGVFTCGAMRAYRRSAPGPIISVAAPTMPTPTLGSELLVDPGVEDWASATDLTNWLETIAGTSTVNREGTIKHGGTYAARLDVAASNSQARISQDFTVIVGDWYRFDMWLYSSASGKTPRLAISSILPDFHDFDPGSDWLLCTITGRATATTVTPRFERSGASASSSHYGDDGSFKKLTLASMFSLVKDAGVKAGVFDCLISTLTAGTQAGDAICLDSETNPLYYLHRYHDGTNFHLDKVENGTPTSLINTAQTWGATVVYRLDIAGTSIAAYADNTKIGNTQTVDTTSNYGTKVATFSTLATNAVTNVEVRGGM